MNYTEIVDASKSYSDRNGLEVADNIDIFIIMAEARINRVLKTREQSTRAFSPTIENSERYALPPDYRGMRIISLNSALPNESPTVSQYYFLNPEQFNIQKCRPFSGKNYYTIIANSFQIHPIQPAGKSIELSYYQKVPTLSAQCPNNWVSDEHPDIYLSGIMAEIETFVKNYSVADRWDSKMGRSIEELQVSDTKERWAEQQITTKLG